MPSTLAVGKRAASNWSRGMQAEQTVCDRLLADGWTLLGRRVRTPAGEIDIVATRRQLLAFIEVKARDRLADAATCLGPRQQARLLAAAECLLARFPEWQRDETRFDLLLVDGAGSMRRIADALRIEGRIEGRCQLS